ncbi:hypothetical protein VTN00DRAFT_6026 [Thermoascus crustaceus]|uniref:uncharacterized protein n=1 Tax=Thermoascus crustaceus TaxID=5088 RepID=UPI0037436EB2
MPSLLGRSDSLDPAMTCRGVTSNGKPCRRPLASPADLYCWQHKDQAKPSTANGGKHGGGGSGLGRVQSKLEQGARTSIDTLVGRLGLLNMDDEEKVKRKHGRNHSTHRPSDSDAASSPTKPQFPQLKPKTRTFCCCFSITEYEAEEDSVPAPRPVEKPPSTSSHQRPSSAVPPPPDRPHHGAASSQTQDLLRWIPPTLPPQTTSQLLGELAKPISEADEAGFIYMFWVTPTSSTRGAPPPVDIASSLLDSSSNHSRRTSDAVRSAGNYYINGTNGNIRLKIGRTSNVQRRLNEWTKQCGHDLTLIRSYPYSPSSSVSSAGGQAPISGKKVPHVHRVERLIHIELGDKRVKGLGPCKDCGKEHREWFEVPAKKEELRMVDECIRRWVEWAERHAR